MGMATVVKAGALDMQVCVPVEWGDEQVKEFADLANPCGTVNGWKIRREGCDLLAGSRERVPCSHSPDARVHIMLDA